MDPIETATRQAAQAPGQAARPQVFLHVGAAKTGTTYLQHVLARNREALRRDGLLYPGQSNGAHFREVQDLRGFRFHGTPDPAVAGSWQRLVDEIRAFGGRAVVSHELFADAGPDDVQRAMSALDFADVHIVFTARELARQIPSTWQEHLKNRHAMTFDSFVGALREQAAAPPWFVDQFWRLQDPLHVLALWAHALPPQRVHVITVPPGGFGRDLLWRRMASVLGVDPDRYDTSVDLGANRSLGAVEANLLRRLNPRIAPRLTWPVYEKWVKRGIAEGILGSRDATIPITLPRSEREWVRARSTEWVAGLASNGYEIVGNLDELVAEFATSEAQGHPDEASEAEQLDAAADVIVGLVCRLEGRAPTAEALPQDPLALARLCVRQLGKRYSSVRRAAHVYGLGKSAAQRLRRVFQPDRS